MLSYFYYVGNCYFIPKPAGGDSIRNFIYKIIMIIVIIYKYMGKFSFILLIFAGFDVLLSEIY